MQMKKKQLAKKALKHPELFTQGELVYFDRWLWYKKQQKSAKINKDKGENS
jgi:hypothetical protein